MKTPNLPTLANLSKRQEEILRAACDGVPDKQIAAGLGLSPRTLEGHWRAIHQKLGTTNRCQAGFIFAALRDNPGKMKPEFEGPRADVPCARPGGHGS